MDSNKVIHGKYFPHIDGIRTIAVLSVVIFHIFASLCPGGFIGVDIFFVISGYLITGGILKSLDKGNFSIKDFYERRIRRIIPAYVVLIAFVMLLALSFPPQLMERIFVTSAFSSIFSTNIFFYLYTGGYFDLSAEANPLLHLWSLGIEEQFYIFTPLFLFLVYKINKKWIFSSLLIVVSISLLLSFYCNYQGKDHASFYLLPTRTWELMSGSLLAYWNKAHPIKSGGAIRRLLGFSGILLSIAICYLYDSSTIFPGVTALPPVIGAILMIRWGGIGLSKSILESKPFVFIGKISYSLYLWHWPLIVYWNYVSNEPSNPLGLSCVFLLSVLFAWASWKFVEMPVRLSESWNLRRALLWVLIGCGSIGFISCGLYLGNFRDYWFNKWADKNNSVGHWERTASVIYNFNTPDIPKNIGFPSPHEDLCFALGSDRLPSYLIWGDSHATAIVPGMDEFSKRNNLSGLFFNRRFPLINREGEDDAYLEKMFEWIKNHEEFKTIIFINRWALRCGEGYNENKSENKNHQAYVVKKPSEIEEFDLKIREFCSRLKQMGRNIVIISSVPEQGTDIPVKLWKDKILGRSILRGISSGKFSERQKNISRIFKNIEQEGIAKVLWINDFFFLNREYSRITTQQGTSLYDDDNHLSPAGAKELMNYYNDKLLELMPREQSSIE